MLDDPFVESNPSSVGRGDIVAKPFEQGSVLQHLVDESSLTKAPSPKEASNVGGIASTQAQTAGRHRMRANTTVCS
jgi:hypothetical protein